MDKNFASRLGSLSPAQLQLLALELQSQLDRQQAARQEPIAIVGMGCRFPGADGPDEFWQLLSRGKDAVREIPDDRWNAKEYFNPDPDAAGTMATRWGGFLEHIDQFDAEFFGIAPREACSMDPQQRLLLEVTWQALEDAGIAPDRLRGTQTGVFVGVCSGDYFQLSVARGYETFDTYLATGGAHSIASGRLSYVLGLEGPAVSIDTACSSSLVAVHLATRSLRGGECRTAIAGGVNAILWPGSSIALSRGRMMASDGRCKAFDARADGFVRGEGCGVVVLKRLSDALSDSDRVLALIRGSAANQDGRSNGLTAPNGRAQTAVIRDALADAGVAPAAVGYVEAHGTGTSLGDPIELHALAAALSPGRDAEDRVWVGSVKTNIGHLEAAAGVAGLMKTVLMLQAQRIAPSLHFEAPNPLIDWTSIPLAVATALLPWEARLGSRIAGVSSFGFSGSNMHVVIEEAPQATPAAGSVDRPLHLCCLSARSSTALAAQATRLARHLADNPQPLRNVCFTTNAGRAHFPHRLAVVTDSVEGLRVDLERFLSAESSPRLRSGRTGDGDAPGVAFLFTGQGAQYPGMGQHLYNTQPTFRRGLDRCEEILKPVLGQSLLEIMQCQPGDHRLDQTLYTQPALFAMEYALASLWQSWGVRPSLVVGHSLGEFPAACIAGVFSLEDGLLLTAERARLTHGLPAGGAMAALASDEHHVSEALARFGGRLSIAAVNGSENTVVSGPAPLVEEIVQEFDARGLRTQRLAVSNAFHSPLVDPVLDEFETVARRVRFSPPRIALVSNVTGGLVTDQVCNPAYWRQHLRQPVRFADGMRAAHDEGYRVFLEVGPHPVLLGMGRLIVGEEPPAVWLPSLRRNRDEWEQMLETLSELYLRGVEIDWNGFDGDYERRRVALPTYPFERQRCWIEDASRRSGPAAAPRAPLPEAGHSFAQPLFDRQLETARGEVVFETRIGTAARPFLLDHRVHGLVVVPAAVTLEMALSAGLETLGSESGAVEDFTIHEALVLSEDRECAIQVIATRSESTTVRVEIHSGDEDSAGRPSWRLIASASVRPGEPAATNKAAIDLAGLRARCPEQGAGAEHYKKLRAAGVEFGAAFQGLERIWRGNAETVGRLRVPDVIAHTSAAGRLHPATLDACLQLIGASLEDPAAGADDEIHLMVGIDRFEQVGAIAGEMWGHASLRAGGARPGESVVADVRLLDDEGHPIAVIEGVRLRRARREALARHHGVRLDDWLYELHWPEALDGSLTEPSWLPPSSELKQSVDAGLESLARECGLDEYEYLVADLEKLAFAYLAYALKALGWKASPGDWLSTAAVAAGLRIATRCRRLLDRLAEMLAEEGVLGARDGGWTVLRPLPTSDPAEQVAAIRSRFPRFKGELALLVRCGERLADVLRGDLDPVHLLFPGGSTSAVEELTERSPAARAYNALVEWVVRAAIARAGNSAVRVIEIGAGTGGTTSCLLPLFPADRTRYTFTDVSRLFLSRAERKFAAYPFVDYRTLDVEGDPCAQGFGGHEFDVVIAANVVHATGDLRRTLTNIRRLLAPSGLLVLLEGTGPQRWVDLTFGLTDGWWKFSDLDLRPSHPLLPRQAWQSLLRSIGFDAVEALPDAAAGAEFYTRQTLVVARGPALGEVQRAETAEALRATTPCTWVLFGEGGGVAEALAAELVAHRHDVVRVTTGTGATQVSDVMTIDEAAPEDYVRALGSIRDAVARPVGHLVHLCSLDATDEQDDSADALDARVAASCRTALYLTQALVSEPFDPKPRLWLVTRNAQPTGAAKSGLSLSQSPLWGLGRTIATEHPEVWGGAIDLALDGPAREATLLVGEIARGGTEDQIALEGGRRRVARLARLRQPTPRTSLVLSPEATYLLTGGTGGMGLRVAEWMVRRGARHLVLIGRSGATRMSPDPSPGQLDLQGRVVVRAADVSCRADLERILAEIGGTMPPLRGVVHVAGVFDDRVLMGLDWPRFERVLAPKVRGAWLLHTLTRDLPLDFFVLFSSGASFLGPVGLGNYAAGNAFLDALAHHRRRLGLPAVSIDWGPWDKVGMAEAVGERRESQWTQGGFARMTADQGLAVMERLMLSAPPQVGVLGVNWAKYVERFGGRVPGLFVQVVQEEGRASGAPIRQADAASPLVQLEHALPTERWNLLFEYVRSEVLRVLGFDASHEIDPDQGLFGLGMDSLTAVELKNRLQTSFGRPLPSTLLFDYPNVQRLASYLGGQVLGWNLEPPGADGVHEARPAERADHDNCSEDELAERLSRKLAQLR